MSEEARESVEPWTDEQTEKFIKDNVLTAPRITPEHIQNCIQSWQYHIFHNSCLTVCCVTLRNGYTVTGESACASPENFNKELGEKIARANAVNKIGGLEGYLLKQALYDSQFNKVAS